MEERLSELRLFLKKCNYPDHIIERGIHNARLQGPAPEKPKEDVLPLVTTYYSNLHLTNNFIKIQHLLSVLKENDDLRPAFEKCNIILSNRQPKNLLKILSKAKFTSEPHEAGNDVLISKCNDSRCNICKMYMQFVNSFILSNGQTWTIKCRMNCNSKNVIYFLLCNRCEEVTYIGKTNNIRNRTNQHISTCRTGEGSDKFDQHVYHCKGTKQMHSEPYFKLYPMLKLDDVSALLTYESHFHKLQYDTMNR